MSDFENFIKNNRTEFDDLEDLSIGGIWKGVESKLGEEDSDSNKEKRVSFFRIRKSYLFAAAASVLLLIGFMAGQKWSVNPPVEKALPSLADISPELAKTEAEFKKLIAQKESEIGLNRLEKEAFAEIFDELDLLESIHEEYRKDIPEFGHNDQLIHTLIKYYEQKIRLLERLSNEIEKLKYYEERKREKHI